MTVPNGLGRCQGHRVTALLEWGVLMIFQAEGLGSTREGPAREGTAHARCLSFPHELVGGGANG